MSPEAWAKRFLEGMVRQGYLKIVKDKKTGQDLVAPA